MKLRAACCLALLLTASGCGQAKHDDDDRPITARAFPRADRPVSTVDKDSISSERARDDRREAETVMDLAKIGANMTVADIGAGEGYYTVRLATRVGKHGRVLAQDINEEAIKRLGIRVERERLDNVSIKLGAEDDPRLPANSFDRIFMVHMYHEVTEPYSFLWHLRPALKPGGSAIVVEADRPTDQHGIPPKQLFCEFDHLGFRLAEFVRKPELQNYYARFEPVGKRPEPRDIEPCNKPGEANDNSAAG